MSRGARAAVAVGLVTALLEGGGQAMVLWHHLAGAPHGFGYWVESLTVDPLVGAMAVLLLVKRADNRTGWVLAADALLGSAQVCFGALASLASFVDIPRGVAVAAAYVSTLAQLSGIAALVLTFMVLPTGRLLSPRWRWAVTLLVAAACGGAGSNLLDPRLGEAAYLADNPLGDVVTHQVDQTITDVAGILLLTAGLLAALSLAVRWRRSTGVERLQLKGIAFAAAVAIVLVGVVAPVGGLLLPSFHLGGTLSWALAGVSVPAATTMAILRYRLYDIDRLVSRTVSYALLTGLLAGVYVGCVVLLTDVLPFGGNVGTAASMLVAVGLFAPLRRRVQHLVDRRFNRARYDAETTVDGFAHRLREAVALESVREDLMSVVCGTVQPKTVSLWLRGLP
ncbi:MAG TPA: hypothetical protein VFJ19_03625 [Nocardioidaceae bacterium]|nr:hypothetical protein [Nocardioidaceae bacterium]